MLDWADMDEREIEGVIAAGKAELERRAQVNAAADALRRALEEFADAAGITVIAAWRAIAPHGAGFPDGGGEPVDVPDFVQPTGAHDAYQAGDMVRFGGKVWRSRIDGNAYSPSAYPQGWELTE